MTVHTRRATDPTAEQLRELLEGLFVEATREPGQPDRRPPSFAPLLRLAASRPHGVHALYHHLARHLISLRLGACWWTDPGGRTHWLLQACAGRCRGGQRAVSDLAESSHGDGLIEHRHALEWFHPEIASGWRTRDGRREFVVACRCGFAGTPESLGWAGPMCGPCHDREEDGLPPLGPDPREPVGVQPSAFHLTPDGRLLAVVEAAGAQRLRVWHAPWEGPPRWRCDWPREGLFAASPTGVVVIGRQDGSYQLRDRRGRVTSEGELPVRGLRALGFAGADGTILVASTSAHGPRLWAWAVTPGGELGEQKYELPLDASWPFAVSPDGLRLLVPDRAGLAVHDAVAGTPLRRLSVPEGQAVTALLGLADGTALATTARSEHRVHGGLDPVPMHRWGPAGPEGRGPDATRDTRCTAWVAGPDGRSVVCVEDEIVVRDAGTLEERARFRPTCDRLLPSLGFTPDGKLVTLTDRGVTAWPWKELF